MGLPLKFFHYALIAFDVHSNFIESIDNFKGVIKYQIFQLALVIIQFPGTFKIDHTQYKPVRNPIRNFPELNQTSVNVISHCKTTEQVSCHIVKQLTLLLIFIIFQYE